MERRRLLGGFAPRRLEPGPCGAVPPGIPPVQPDRPCHIRAMDLWTIRLRRTGRLAVDNASRYPPRLPLPTSSTAHSRRLPWTTLRVAHRAPADSHLYNLKVKTIGLAQRPKIEMTAEDPHTTCGKTDLLHAENGGFMRNYQYGEEGTFRQF